MKHSLYARPYSNKVEFRPFNRMKLYDNVDEEELNCLGNHSSRENVLLT